MGMKRNSIAISVLSLGLALPAGLLTVIPANAQPAGFYQDRGWDEPAAEFRDAQRKGYHDGIDAARHDYDHHERKDVVDHDHFRHPPVDHSLRDDYRDGFRRGYETAMQHMADGPHDH